MIRTEVQVRRVVRGRTPERMVEKNRDATYRLDRWAVDLRVREIRLAGVVVPLGSRAFDIFQVLLLADGAVMTKKDLALRVWGDRIVEENTLQVHISAVRKALGPDRRLLKTASGRSYYLVGGWIPQDDASDSPEASASSDPGLGIALLPPTSTAGAHLPIALNALIGREAAKQRIRLLMASYRVVTLVGSGGIGKTRLAVAVAEEVRSDFPGGIGDRRRAGIELGRRRGDTAPGRGRDLAIGAF